MSFRIRLTKDGIIWILIDRCIILFGLQFVKIGVIRIAISKQNFQVILCKVGRTVILPLKRCYYPKLNFAQFEINEQKLV